MRTIVVNDVEYKWQVGRQYVEIRGPGVKLTPTKTEATLGYHVDRDFEKGNASITPAMIAEYIKQNVSNA